MSKIKKVTLESKRIIGFKVRTKNADEMNSDTQKIAPLWGKFFNEIMPTLEKNTYSYGVYCNYESDAQGEFDVLVGADSVQEIDEIQSEELESGEYLMFPVKGELPQAVIDTWVEIWAYFDDPSIDVKRAYKTDFELYKSEDEAEIYIGVDYL